MLKLLNLKNKNMKKLLPKVRMFLGKNKTAALLLLIVIFGAFFRLYNFSDLVRFNTDQVRDVLIVEKILEGKDFPLLGPKAGGTTFKLGPAFYYIEAFSGLIFGNTPSGMAMITAILSIASIPLLFLFARYYFSANISLLMAFGYSFSFYVIKYSHFAWNPNIIPFFFLLFLISILKFIELKNKKSGVWHLLLAISMGIGVQLHTLLLILMPLIFLLACAYVFFKERKIYFVKFIIISVAVLLINAPFFAYDLQNNGKNVKSFFAGTEKKTKKNTSLADNILKDGQFFIQGSTYALSSFEPQKNWIKVKKLLDSKKTGEISAALAGTLFFIFGFALLVKRFLDEKNEKRRVFLGMVFSSLLLSFLMLFPIANELNVRYLIILIFLPYVFLGLILDFLLKKVPAKISIAVIIVALLFLAVLNIRTYAKTYNLDNYTARTSTYGGISVKESRDISNFMFELSKKMNLSGKMVFPASFKFAPSIEYFNDKKELEFVKDSEKEQRADLVYFAISDEKDVEKTLKEKEESFKIINSAKTGRFTVFALERK